MGCPFSIFSTQKRAPMLRYAALENWASAVSTASRAKQELAPFARVATHFRAPFNPKPSVCFCVVPKAVRGSKKSNPKNCAHFD